MKTAPAIPVLQWLNDANPGTLFFTSISVGEIEFGLRSLPISARRSHLTGLFEAFLERAFAGRILEFDLRAARYYGELMGERRAMGMPLGIADGQIAATARANGFGIATRNVRDFRNCGLEIVNPFSG